MDARLSTLANGCKVITDEMPHVHTCAMGLWIGVGSLNESAEINGISHMLEHMVFKGTSTRTARQIAETIESVGGYLNAYTSREMTAYHARILKEDVTLATQVLADMLQNSLFDPVEFSREQDVVIQEIGQTLDTPDDIIFDYFQELCYPNQSLGRPILGSESLIRSFTPEKVKQYKEQTYSFDRMVFAAAGHISHDQAIDLAESALQNFQNQGGCEQDASPVFQGGSQVFEKELEQAHIVFGFEGVSYDHPWYDTASIYSTLLGGGMSSRLFQEIREKRGLVYTISAFPTSYSTTGQFSIYAATSPTQVKELLPVLYDELRKVPKSLTMEEVDRAKTQLKAGLMMGAESPMARCEQAARQTLIYGNPLSLSEIRKRVDDVTLDHLIDFSTFLLTQKTTLVGHGLIDTLLPFSP